MSTSQVLKYLNTTLKAFLWSVIALFILVIVVEVFDLPTSIPEAKFRWKINAVAASNAPQINLADIQKGDWELVCDSHGYGGSTYVPKYNRTYEAVGESQDNYWGLIFISPNSSYVPITGHCGKSSPDIYIRGCRKKEDAILYKHASDKYSRCPRYEDITEAQKRDELNKMLNRKDK